MNTNMTTGIHSSSFGTLNLDTYSEATKSRSAVAGAGIGPSGAGIIASTDGHMNNSGNFSDWSNETKTYGNLYHYSLIKAATNYSETHNVFGLSDLTSDPKGSTTWSQPFAINSVGDPIIAWSRTTGKYYQQH